MMKLNRYFKITKEASTNKIVSALILSLLLVSCDSGDIYPDEYQHDEGITASATYTFDNLDAFPNDYPLIFGVFNDKQSTPLASVRIMKPKNDSPVDVSIENLPSDATSIKLCLTDLGRQPVFVLHELEINMNNNDNIIIPESKVNLVSYNRIQNLIFEQYTCVACHQGNTGAGKLLLTTEKSYNSLVNTVSSKNPAKNRVTPSQTDNSFLLDVLTDENLSLTLTQPHTSFVTRNDDIKLLEEWIKNGCNK